MYRKNHNGQLSIEEFHVPFGGTLDPENRWILFATLMPSDETEEAYAHQLSPTTRSPAKPAREVTPFTGPVPMRAGGCGKAAFHCWRTSRGVRPWGAEYGL
jgi:hypothetical protein